MVAIGEMYIPLFGVMIWLIEIIVILGIWLIAAATYLTLYSLQAVGLQKMAKSRNIKNGWLAWLPVGNSWIAGRIAEEHRKAHGQKEIAFGKFTALTAAVALGLMALIYVVYFLLMLLVMGIGMVDSFVYYYTDMDFTMLIPLLTFLFYVVILSIAFLAGVINTAHSVLVGFDSYFIFASCDPSKKLIYLLVGLGIGLVLRVNTIGYSVFIFLCRDKGPVLPKEKATVQIVE